MHERANPDNGNRYQRDRRRLLFDDDKFPWGNLPLLPKEVFEPFFERRSERSARDVAAVKVFGGRIDVARSALEAIGNDDLDYDEWFRRLCAIHYEGDGSDEWCELAHEYSRKSGKYDAKTTDEKWDSIKDKHADPVTGATIRRLAYKAGWTPESAGFPDFQWGDGWTEAGAQIVFEDERDIQERIDSMNVEFAVVKNGGSVCVLHECKDSEGAPTFDLLPVKDFKILTQNRGVVKAVSASGKATKGKPIADYWLASPQRREHMGGLVFRPGEELRPPEGSNGYPACFNTWTGWGVAPSARGSCGRFKDHVRDVICGGDIELFNYVFDWLAHIVQRPWEKPGVALVLIGPQGAGKSIFGRVLGKLVGRAHYFVASQESQLTGNFNAHLGRALLVQGEEAFFVHDARSRRVLKDLITRETKTVEPKCVNAYVVDSFERYVLTSNEEAVVHAGKGERRFTVIRVRGVHARETEYFENLIAQLEDGGYERLMWELSQRDIRGFNCREPFETEALAEQKLHGLDPTSQWMRSELMSGELWENDRGEPRSVVDKRELAGSYRDFAQRTRIRYPLDDAQLGKWIKQALGWKTVRPRSNRGGRERAFQLPDLADARTAFVASFELPANTFDDDVE